MRLRKPSIENEVKSFSINENGRDFFIGDLHGHYEAFENKLDKINFDSSKDRIFSVGDLIDRGEESEKCLRLLEEPWFHSVLGNHEAMMIEDYMHDTWMVNGGVWVYSCSPKRIDELKELIRKKMSFLFEVETHQGKIGIVHAEPQPDWKYINAYVNLWSRSKILGKDESHIRGIDLVVCGHTPNKEIVKLGNTIWIDTGAVWTNNLTCMTATELFNLK